MAPTTQPLREIKLYGHLGKTFGKVHRFAVDSAAEAIQALCSQFPGFRKQVLAHNDPGYRIYVGNYGLPAEQLHLRSRTLPIKIVPHVAGAGGSGGLGQILLGAVLIAASLYMPTLLANAAAWAPVTGGVVATLSGVLFNMGAALMLGGVLQLMTKPPKARKDEKKDQSSYLFNGAVNVSAEGVPVPLLYGELEVGSAVINAEITSVDDRAFSASVPDDNRPSVRVVGGTV